MNLVISVCLSAAVAGMVSWWLSAETMLDLMMVSGAYVITQLSTLFLLHYVAPKGEQVTEAGRLLRKVLLIFFGIILCASLWVIVMHPELY